MKLPIWWNTDPACFRCKHYTLAPQFKDGEEPFGICRRYPPVLNSLLDPEDDDKPCNELSGVTWRWEHPVVQWSDTCGEFKAKYWPWD